MLEGPRSRQPLGGTHRSAPAPAARRRSLSGSRSTEFVAPATARRRLDNSPSSESVGQISLVGRVAGIGRSAVVRRAARRIAIVTIAIAGRTLKARVIRGVFVMRWRWKVMLVRRLRGCERQLVGQDDRTWPIVVRRSGSWCGSAGRVLPGPPGRRHTAPCWPPPCRQRIDSTRRKWIGCGRSLGRRRLVSSARQKRQNGSDHRHIFPFMDWFSFRTLSYYRCVQRTYSTSQRRPNLRRRFLKQRIIERITGWQTTQEISWHRSSSTWWRLGPRLRSASMNKTSWQISPSRNWVRSSVRAGSRRNATRSEPPVGTKKKARHTGALFV